MLEEKNDSKDFNFDAYVKLSCDFNKKWRVSTFGSYLYGSTENGQFCPTWGWAQGNVYRGEFKLRNPGARHALQHNDAHRFPHRTMCESISVTSGGGSCGKQEGGFKKHLSFASQKQNPWRVRFIIIHRVYYPESSCNRQQNLLMTFYALISKIGIDEPKTLGFDTSMVVVERVPLIINRHNRSSRRIGQKMDEIIEDEFTA